MVVFYFVPQIFGRWQLSAYMELGGSLNADSVMGIK